MGQEINPVYKIIPDIFIHMDATHVWILRWNIKYKISTAWCIANVLEPRLSCIKTWIYQSK